MSQRLSGYTSVLNISAEETMAWSGAMASLGINVEEGGNSLGRTLLKFNEYVSKGDDGLKTLAKTAGVTDTAFAKLWSKDKSKATQEVVKGLYELKEAGVDITAVLSDLGIQNTRDRTTLLKLASGYETLESAITMANDEFIRNQALQIEAEKRFGTTESKLKILKNQLSATGITVFDTLKPTIDDLLTSLTDFTKGVGEFVGKLKPQEIEFFVKVLGTLIALAPALKLLNVGMQLSANAIDLFTSQAQALKNVPTNIANDFKNIATQGSRLSGLKSIFSSLGRVIPTVGLAIYGVGALMESMPNKARDFVNIINESFVDFDNKQLGIDEATISSWNDLNDKISSFRTTLSLAKLDNQTFNLKDLTEGSSQQLDIIKQSFNGYVNQRITKETELVNRSKILSQQDKDNHLRSVKEKYSDEITSAETILGKIGNIQANASAKGRSLTQPEVKKIEGYYLDLQELVQGLDLTPPTEGEKFAEMAKSGIKLTAEEQKEAIKSITTSSRDELAALNREFLSGPQTKGEYEQYLTDVRTAMSNFATDISPIVGETSVSMQDFYKSVGGPQTVGEQTYASFFENATSSMVTFKDKQGNILELSKGDFYNYLNGIGYAEFPNLYPKSDKMVNDVTTSVDGLDLKQDIQNKLDDMNNTYAPDLSDKGKKSGSTIPKGFKSADIETKTQNILDGVDVSAPNMTGVGADMARGVVAGFGSIDIGGSLGRLILNSIPDVDSLIGRKSPAKKFMPIGRDIVRGVAVGYEQGDKWLKSASVKMTQNATTYFNSSASKISIAFTKAITGGLTNSMRTSSNFAYNAGKTMITGFKKGVSDASMTTAQNKNQNYINKQVYGQIMSNEFISDEDKATLKKQWNEYLDMLETQQSQEQAISNVTTLRDTKLKSSQTKRNKEVARYKKTAKAKKYSDKWLDKKIASADKRQTTRDLLIEQNYELDISAINDKYGSLEKARQELEALGYTVDFQKGSETLKITGKQDTNIDNSTNYYTVNANNVDEQVVIELLYKEKRRGGLF